MSQRHEELLTRHSKWMKAVHVWQDRAISRPLEVNGSLFSTGSYLMHQLCAKEGSGAEMQCCGSPPPPCSHEWELLRQAPDCLRWGRCCYWLIIDRCSFHVYNGEEGSQTCKRVKKKKKKCEKEKGCKFKVEKWRCWCCCDAESQNKIKSQDISEISGFSFCWKQLSASVAALQCLLLLLVSANVLTGCSSAPPPFCSQASLHIFSNKKKKGKRRSGPLPVVVLWRPDFIQAPGSGIISMQMFVVAFFFFTAIVIAAGSREDESGGRARRLLGSRRGGLQSFARAAVLLL